MKVKPLKMVEREEQRNIAKHKQQDSQDSNLEVCKGICHGCSSPESQHNCAGIPAYQAARIKLQLPNQLAIC